MFSRNVLSPVGSWATVCGIVLLEMQAVPMDIAVSAKRKKTNEDLWEPSFGIFHNFCALPVCKMLKVSVLQRLELINTVETGHFSTERVENPRSLRAFLIVVTRPGNSRDRGSLRRCFLRRFSEGTNTPIHTWATPSGFDSRVVNRSTKSDMVAYLFVRRF